MFLCVNKEEEGCKTSEGLCPPSLFLIWVFLHFDSYKSAGKAHLNQQHTFLRANFCFLTECILHGRCLDYQHL